MLRALALSWVIQRACVEARQLLIRRGSARTVLAPELRERVCGGGGGWGGRRSRIVCDIEIGCERGFSHPPEKTNNVIFSSVSQMAHAAAFQSAIAS